MNVETYNEWMCIGVGVEWGGGEEMGKRKEKEKKKKVGKSVRGRRKYECQ